MSPKFKRNELCWCGSGKKYKKCHLDREARKPAQPWEVDAQIRVNKKQGECLHVGNADGAICGKTPIGSHTVPKKMLKQIARNGHVYSHSAAMQELSKTQGRLAVKLIGVNDASVLPIFCQPHDGDTFIPLEQTSFIATKEQCFLLAYRAICLELAKKRQALDFMDVMKSFDRGMPLPRQAIMQTMLEEMMQGSRLGLRDLEKNKESFDLMLRTKNYAAMRAYIVTFENMPDVLCAAAHYPQCGFTGDSLQDLSDFETIMQPMSFSLITTDNGGAFVFAWTQENDDICRPLAASLDCLPDIEIPHAIIRFVFEFCENHYLRPDWWEALPSTDKDKVTDRIQIAASPIKRFASCLMDDGLRIVSWVVVNKTWLL